MRRLAAFIGALALVAGCASGAGSSPGVSTAPAPVATLGPAVTAAPAPSGSPTAGPSPSPAPSASPTAVSARVTFDGKECVYSGPTVIPAPAVLTLEYAPTPAMETSAVFVVAIRSGTTQADIDRTNADPDALVGVFVPEWADEGSFNAQQGSGSAQYPLRVLHDPGDKVGVFDRYSVACIIAFPGHGSGRGAILQLVDAAAPAAVQATEPPASSAPSAPPLATIGRPADNGARIVQVDEVDARTRDLTIESPSVGEVRVRLLLPAAFTAQSATRWPVLYLLHGAGRSSVAWTRISDVEDLTASSDILVVMPDGSAGGMDGWYTDWTNGGADGKRAWETFHLAELRQLLERNWNAGDRRAVAGLSMGGYGAMVYAARNPGMFRAAASYSGVLDIVGGDFKAPPGRWGDKVAQAETWKQHDPLTLAPKLKGTALYVAYGNGQPGPLDPAGAANDDLEAWIGTQGDAFVARLKQLGIPVTVDAYGPGTHSDPYWERALHRSLPMLLKALGASGG